MGRNLPASTGDVGSVLGPGRSYILWSIEAQAPWLLHLCSRAWEPQLPKPKHRRAHALQPENHRNEEPGKLREAPTHHNWRKACASMKTQTKINLKKIFLEKSLKDKICDRNKQAQTWWQIQQPGVDLMKTSLSLSLSLWASKSRENFLEEVQPNTAFLKDKDWNSKYHILPFWSSYWPPARCKAVNDAMWSCTGSWTQWYKTKHWIFNMMPHVSSITNLVGGHTVPSAPFYRWAERSTERLSNLPKITQPGSSDAGIQIRDASLLSLCYFLTVHHIIEQRNGQKEPEEIL